MRQPAASRWRAALAILATLALAACALAASVASAPTPRDPAAKIHNASADGVPLFARIVFTRTTTYDQAVTLLVRDPYPWTCDDPATPTPPPPAALRATYTATHALLVSYPGWDWMARLARSAQVVEVDGATLYPCP
jgi:hypothetical protein